MIYDRFKDYLWLQTTKHKPPRRRMRNIMHTLTDIHGPEYVVNMGFRACANLLTGYGCTLTKLCEDLGKTFDPSLENTLAIKAGGFFVNYMHINHYIKFKPLPDKTVMVLFDDPKFEEFMKQFAWKKRTQNITEQPLPWVKPWSKGVPIVKYLNPLDAHHYVESQMPEVYRALNILQDTKWMINSPILSLMCEGYDGFSPTVVEPELVSMARKRLTTIKARSVMLGEWILEQQVDDPDISKYAKQWAKQTSLNKFKESSKEFAEICKEYSKMAGFVKAVELAISVEHENLYFQHNCDYRGRIYSLSNELSPQGADFEKALLRFATPGKTDEHWQKVHIANCAGHDKISYADRVQWVDDNMTAIKLIGMAPREDEARAWLFDQGIVAEEKTRWQFIAACMEWVSYEETGEWLIPIDCDATSSGLQFLCALSRDEGMAGDVNVSQCDYAPVGDIYQKVGDAFLDVAPAEKVPFISHLDKGNKTLRKLAKRPTMVFPYSGQADAMSSSLYDDRDTFGDTELKKLTYGNCSTLGNYFFKTLKTSLPRASALMRAMQDSFVGYDGPPMVTWRGPTGFRAFQNKMKRKQIQVQIKLDRYGVNSIRVIANMDTDEPNNQKHKSAIAPNVIHHLDAALMVKTINAMADEGCVNFHAIHDSFGTHPGYIDLMNSKVRSNFYKIVTVDWISDIMKQATGRYTAPEKGTWNPRDVLTSPYFLC